MSGEVKFEPVIGLEIHAQLKTQTKLFSAEATSFGDENNRVVSSVSLGLPGALPVLNKQAVMLALKVGLGFQCKINPVSDFSRKHYFYPDLPKGYQISQGAIPLMSGGFVEVEDERIHLERIHIEEDAGQSYHIKGATLVNLNRAGTPLIEIVSKPEIRSAKQAGNFVRKVRQVLRYLDVCDGNLQEGSLRCDCNVSIRPKGASEFGTRVEIKNVNSFKFIEKAIEFEIERQVQMAEDNVSFSQQTRTFDPATGETLLLRDKEGAKDYRYFPDPDLQNLVVSDDMIGLAQKSMVELPDKREQRFISDFALTPYDAHNLTREKDLADYYEEALSFCEDAKLLANWVLGEVSRYLNEQKKTIFKLPFPAKDLGELVSLISSGQISGKIGKTVFEKMLQEQGSPDEIIESCNLRLIKDRDQIAAWVREVISENQSQHKAYLGGKDKLFGFFVGKSMAKSDGRADPKLLQDIVKEVLGSS